MNTRFSGALRRAEGRDPSVSADEPVDLRRRWRTTLAGVVVATMALGGMTALAATPAAADEAAVAEQSETVVAEPAAAEPAAEEPVAEEPAAEPAAPPADDAEEPAAEPAAPAEEPAVPAEEPVEAPAAEGETPAGPAPPTEAEAAAAADVTALLVPPGVEVVDKVEICHATASYRNPYVINEPAADGDVQGHADHTGLIFFPEIEEQWGDIIPPFYYDDGGEEPAFFPGLNWTEEGQAIYENDCVAGVPDPILEYSVVSCIPGEQGTGRFDFSLSGLVAAVDYRIELFDANDDVVAEWEFAGDTGTVEGSAGALAPGDYTVVVSVFDGELEEWVVVTSAEFTVEPCPELAVEAAATGCSLGDDGTALVSLSGLVEGEDYEWLLSGDDYFLEGTLEDVEGGSLDVPFGDLPPGNYVFAIVWAEDTSIYAEAEFFVEPCEPDITVVVTECPAYGGEGSALLKLSNLVEGVEYDVWVTAKGDMDGTVYDGIRTITGGASHMAEIEISPLAAGEDYTAWVHGVWTIPEFVEQPEPIEEFELHASVDFSLKPCPPAPATPVTPAKVKPAGLATTGTDDTGGLMTAAFILLGLGGAALVARGRRQAQSRVNE